jgi:hypothetical protein
MSNRWKDDLRGFPSCGMIVEVASTSEVPATLERALQNERWDCA